MFWQFLDNNLMVILAFILANKAVSFLIAMSLIDKIQSEKAALRGSKQKSQSHASYSSLRHIDL